MLLVRANKIDPPPLLSKRYVLFAGESRRHSKGIERECLGKFLPDHRGVPHGHIVGGMGPRPLGWWVRDVSGHVIDPERHQTPCPQVHAWGPPAHPRIRHDVVVPDLPQHVNWDVDIQRLGQFAGQEHAIFERNLVG